MLLLAQALVLAGLVEVEGASPTREGVVTQGTGGRSGHLHGDGMFDDEVRVGLVLLSCNLAKRGDPLC